MLYIVIHFDSVQPACSVCIKATLLASGYVLVNSINTDTINPGKSPTCE